MGIVSRAHLHFEETDGFTSGDFLGTAMAKALNNQ